ncbi:DUF6624 domain-containing protein [Nitrospirillum sp. BR 11828]|uniref:DUF6624 domain-containing protein n=1 Tax=Nitrospirillum sp. BR 11828 TaxID=3104325 RepID=UPI002ACA1B61|nr:DUF6624 domain-containing protein [Nitrospirillum sp. BR 11828]MDZ5649276.1 DUF6624 domain-containing protein [Nitrospirillum sp. BR 11828]
MRRAWGGVVLALAMMAATSPAGAIYIQSPTTGPLAEAAPQAAAYMARAQSTLDEHACDPADPVCALGIAAFANTAAFTVGHAACDDQACEAQRATLEADYRAKADAIRARVARDDTFVSQEVVGMVEGLRARGDAPSKAQVDALLNRAQTALNMDACPITTPACVEGELTLIWDMDQMVRAFPNCNALAGAEVQACWQALGPRMRATDAYDRRRLRRLMEAIGWPSERDWGRRAATGAWLVAQHSGRADPDLQAAVLVAVKAAVDAGKSPAAQYAYLFDRQAVSTGKEQMYGTQGGCDPARKAWVMSPVADPDGLAERRAALGLEPMALYQQQSDRFCRGGKGNED